MPRSEFEITLELYSVISPQLETKTFYTVFLEIGKNNDKQIKKKPNFQKKNAPPCQE